MIDTFRLAVIVECRHKGHGFHVSLSERPFRASLDELVHQQAQVGQDEATHEEREELCRVTDAQLEADVRLRRVLEARIFDLASDLICNEKQGVVSGYFSDRESICMWFVFSEVVLGV